MENNKEKLTEKINVVDKPLEETIENIEASLKEIKTKAAHLIKKDGSKLEKVKEKGDELKNVAKNIKTKYEEIDPFKQKMIVVGISVSLASIFTALALKCLSNQLKNKKQ